ncbi:MAG: 50S ribosomal protein L9 [Lentisphaerae bacterium RIFOXYB12_FULL_65_16]|nr:MAG: 50S ribosomal protein L9 [Lentisphaerae bacterium RIFOXYA12_64_32]OGV90249.1 MAG: 50S ribosomal protein L9 [Lentisphaerae bacterium RIFOXYB12_FULL_65_16]
MELVLVDDVEGLGRLGDYVRVADGYARNFLLPRKLAAAVTPDVLRQLEGKKLRLQKEHEQRVAVAQAMADKIGKLSVTIAVEATDDDKLYGSVTQMQIVEALAKEGIEIEREAVVLADPIKELGVYNVDVRLHADVQAAVKVWVVRI